MSLDLFEVIIMELHKQSGYRGPTSDFYERCVICTNGALMKDEHQAIVESIRESLPLKRKYYHPKGPHGNATSHSLRQLRRYRVRILPKMNSCFNDMGTLGNIYGLCLDHFLVLSNQEASEGSTTMWFRAMKVQSFHNAYNSFTNGL